MIRFLYGSNDFAIDAVITQRIDHAIEVAGELGVERFDGTETTVATIEQSMCTPPFLVAEKLVVIRHGADNLDLVAYLVEASAQCADGVEVLCDIRGIDRRKALFKQLQKTKNLEEYRDMSPTQLEDWLVAEAKQLGGALSKADAAYLLSRVGSNQRLLRSELEKLVLFSEVVDKKSIDALTEPALQSTIFALLDAAFSGNAATAHKIYAEQRAASVEPQYILSMLVWQLSQLAVAVYALGEAEHSLVQAGISPYSARKAAQLAKHTHKAKLNRLIEATLDADLAAKTNAEPDDAVAYIISVAAS